MLLTYPSKESLLRNLNERPIGDVFLIVANYKSLANWSLIPLKKMSLFLGPNSAGKSIAYEVIDILRDIDLLCDECIPKNADRYIRYSGEESIEPVVGFSMPYFLEDTLDSTGFSELDVSSGDMGVGGVSGEGLGAYFVTEGMLKDRFLHEALKNTRYTMIYSRDSGQEIFLNDLVASRRNGDRLDGDDAFFEFTKVAIDNLYKPAVRFRNNNNAKTKTGVAGEYYGSNGELMLDPCFEGLSLIHI